MKPNTLWDDIKLLMHALMFIFGVCALSIGLFWLVGALPIQN